MRVVCIINGYRAGIELQFTEKPDLETRAKLESAGFKWDRIRNAWFAERSRTAFALVEKLTLEDAYDTEQEFAVQMLDYESGRMPTQRIPTFFQLLIDSAIILDLNESYRSKAVELVSAGYCHRRDTTVNASGPKATVVRTKMADLAIEREKAKPAINVQISQFEGGRMCNEDIPPFFQSLIDSRLILTLSSHYCELARDLLKDGRCHCSGGMLKELNALK